MVKLKAKFRLRTKYWVRVANVGVFEDVFGVVDQDANLNGNAVKQPAVIRKHDALNANYFYLVIIS